MSDGRRKSVTVAAIERKTHSKAAAARYCAAFAPIRTSRQTLILCARAMKSPLQLSAVRGAVAKFTKQGRSKHTALSQALVGRRAEASTTKVSVTPTTET
jgi:hypothetical protein